MSVDTTLKSLITPLVAGGCHRGVNDSQQIVAPYVVFHEIYGEPLNTISDYTGVTKSRYQVDVFAKTPEQAKGLALGVIMEAIQSSPIIQGDLIFRMDGQYSDLDKTYQYITEYTIWAA